MPPFWEGELRRHLLQCGLGRGLLRIKWHLDPSSRLVTMDMERKLGTLRRFWEGELGPHLTQCRLGFPTKWHLDPSSHLATTDMGGKLGPFWFSLPSSKI